jgi:hypothetical protein
MAQADATIANVATPSIRADLGASGSALELVIGGYLIAFAVLLITGARLGQTHGARPRDRVLRDRAVLGRGARTTARRSADRREPRRQRVAADLPRQRADRPGRRPGRGAQAARRRADRGPRDRPGGVAMLSAGILLVVLPLVLGRAGGWPAWTCARPVPAGRPWPQRRGIRAHARPVGRGVRRRRPDRAPVARSRRGAGAFGRLPPARGRLCGDQRHAVQRRTSRRRSSTCSRSAGSASVCSSAP